jgi:hypothetical protein
MLFSAVMIAGSLLTAASAQTAPYHVTGQIKTGGEGGRDCLRADDEARLHLQPHADGRDRDRD